MSALGWDQGRVYHAHVLPGEDQSPDAAAKLEQQFYDFILEFRLDSSYIYRYKPKLLRLILLVISCRRILWERNTFSMSMLNI
jgi:hypothetical protein